MFRNSFSNYIKLFLVFFISITGISSFYYLFSESENIKLSIKKNFIIKQDKKQDLKWANEIINGGYILLFRHAEREKWIDVSIYDAIESDLKNKEGNKRYGENEYFEEAVCLNSKGKIQAKAMNEVIKYSGLPIGYIVSSPSCRARQTAQIAFGGYDKLDRNLLHKSPFLENISERNKFLKEYFLNLPLKKDTNTIVSSHNSVADCSMFKNKFCDLKLGEGGFYVIKKENENLILAYEFHNFKSFSKVFFPREY